MCVPIRQVDLHGHTLAESPDTNEVSGLLDINFRNQNYFWITNLTFLEAPAPVIRSVYPAEGRLL